MGLFTRLGDYGARMFAYRELKSGASFINKLVRALFKTERVTTPAPESPIELTLDESLRHKKMHRFLLLTSISFVAFLCGFVALAYNLAHGYAAGSFVSVAFCFMSAVLTFRYHFWWMQLKHKKLGMRFKDWYRLLIGKEAK